MLKSAEVTSVDEYSRLPISLHVVSASFHHGEDPKARQKDDEPGDIPPQVLGESVIDDSEPGEHLAEKPAAEAVGDAHLGAPHPDGALRFDDL